MKGRTVLIAVGILGAGLLVAYVVSQSGSTIAGSGLRNDTGNFWGFAGHALTDLEKAVPSWFTPKPPTDAELNLYPSSSGFADHGADA